MTLDELIETLQEAQQEGYGKEHVLLTDWQCNSNPNGVTIMKGKVLLHFTYGSAD